MTKFKPEELEWVAIHDKKIVSYPNYIDIDRSTLKEFQLRKGDKVIFSLKNPKKLFMRLRTYGATLKNPNGEKCWIIGNSDPLEYYIITQEKTEKFNEWGNIPRQAVVFREDEI